LIIANKQELAFEILGKIKDFLSHYQDGFGVKQWLW
jgi:hypothetical protein